VALIFLCLAWELWLAPLRTGGSSLAFKALPLLLPLFGVLRGKRYTYQWSSMLILAYFTEGVVRAWSERGHETSMTWSICFATKSSGRPRRPCSACSGRSAVSRISRCRHSPALSRQLPS